MQFSSNFPLNFWSLDDRFSAMLYHERRKFNYGIHKKFSSSTFWIFLLLFFLCECYIYLRRKREISWDDLLGDWTNFYLVKKKHFLQNTSRDGSLFGFFEGRKYSCVEVNILFEFSVPRMLLMFLSIHTCVTEKLCEELLRRLFFMTTMPWNRNQFDDPLSLADGFRSFCFTRMISKPHTINDKRNVLHVLALSECFKRF